MFCRNSDVLWYVGCLMLFVHCTQIMRHLYLQTRGRCCQRDKNVNTFIKLREKVQVIKDIEKGLPSKEVAAEYNAPEYISPWVKNKDKILSPLEEGENVK